MQLRLATRRVDCANPLAVLDAGGYRCSWCGFAAMVGIRAYVDDDGDRIACSVCDAARHAGIGRRDRFRPIWLPEMTQPQLSHLARCIAWAKTQMAARGKGYSAIHAKLKAVDPRLYAELSARGDILDRTCRDHLDGPPEKVVGMLPPPIAATLVQGMRILPVAFPASEISAWSADESSFAGLGLAALEDRHWYVNMLGLTSVGIEPLEEGSF